MKKWTFLFLFVIFSSFLLAMLRLLTFEIHYELHQVLHELREEQFILSQKKLEKAKLYSHDFLQPLIKKYDMIHPKESSLWILEKN